MNGWRGPTQAEFEAAARVAPETVRGYLAATGWRPRPGLEEPLWTLVEDDHEFEVLLPIDRRFRDYPLRVYDVLHTLAVLEDRGFDAVLAELLATDLDTMTFRLLPGGAPGTVPLLNGADALAGVRELVLASTYAAILDRPLMVQGRRPAKVRQFAQQVRLGTPREGSWVIAAQLQLPTGPAASESPDPFPRQVSMQAHSAVGAALRAAGEALRGDPIEPFRQRAEEGVSANVCEALAKLGRDDTAYEVRFGWASRQPAPPGGRRFRFDPPVITALREAAELLRRLPDGRVEVAGTVTKLSRTEGETGEVVITGEVRTERWAGEQNVRVRLTRERYDQAVQAHRVGRTVRLVGVAHRGRVVSVVQMTVADG